MRNKKFHQPKLFTIPSEAERFARETGGEAVPPKYGGSVWEVHYKPDKPFSATVHRALKPGVYRKAARRHFKNCEEGWATGCCHLIRWDNYLELNDGSYTIVFQNIFKPEGASSYWWGSTDKQLCQLQRQLALLLAAEIIKSENKELKGRRPKEKR
jgi:hypothetical protein